MIRIYTYNGDIDVQYERYELPLGWWKYIIHECESCVELGFNYGMPSVFYSRLSLGDFRLADNATVLEYMDQYTYNTMTPEEDGNEPDASTSESTEQGMESRNDFDPIRNALPDIYDRIDPRTEDAQRTGVPGNEEHPSADAASLALQTYAILADQFEQDQAAENAPSPPSEENVRNRRTNWWTRREPGPSGPSAETTEDTSEGLESFRAPGIIPNRHEQWETFNAIRRTHIAALTDNLGVDPSAVLPEPDLSEPPEDSGAERPEVLIPRAQRGQTRNGNQSPRNRERTGVRRPLP